MGNNEKIKAWCIHNFNVHPSHKQLEDIVSVLNEHEKETSKRYLTCSVGILDTETNLLWQNITRERCTWDAAKLLEVDGWRLPTIEELRTIVDKTKSPSIDPIFTDTVQGRYWSASPYANYSYDAWVVHFDDGYEGANYKDDSNYVRLVRGGQEKPTVQDVELQDEIRRRDEIIDSYKGIELDCLFYDAKIEAIRSIIESRASDSERIKLVLALLRA